MSTTILAVTWPQALITVLFVLICVLLILVILIQKGRGGGLSGAFGGVGGHSAFGAKTGDVFTWITIGLTAGFILMAVLGNYAFQPAPIQPETTAVTPAPDDAAPPEAPEGSATQSG